MKIKLAKFALRLSVIYAVVGCLWIQLSGRALSAMTSDPKVLVSLDIFKDWGFVVVTAVLLYVLLHRQLGRWEHEATERKRVEEALNFSEEQHRIVLENQTEIICRFKSDGTYLFVNNAFCRFFGKTREQLLGNKWQPEVVPADLPQVEKKIKMLSPANPIVQVEYQVRSGSGEIHWMQFNHRALFDEQNRLVEIQAVGRDVTERKQTEEALRNSERLLRSVMDLVPHFIFVKDNQSRHLLVNRACAEAANLTADQMVGLSDLDLAPGSAQAEAFMKDDREVIRSGRPKFGEEKLTDARGQTRILQTTKIPFPASTTAFPGAENGKPAILGVSVDVTALKQAQDALNRERLLLRTLIDNLPDAIYAKDKAGRKILSNPADAENCHCQAEAEVLGKTDFDFYPREIAEKFWVDDQKVLQGQEVINREEYLLDEKGRKRWLLTSKLPLHDQHNEIVGLVGIGRDLTDRKTAEEELRHLNRSLRALSKCNEVLVRATNENSLLTRICEIITEVGEYKMAWVGYAVQDEAKSVKPVAQAGAESGYLEPLRVTWADTELGRGPVGTAIRTGQPAIFLDLAKHAAFAPWREEALRRGFSACIALPLKSSDKTFGVLCVYSSRPNAFDVAETALLAELAADLAFGISILRSRSERNQLEEQLRQAQKMEAIGQLAGGVAHDFNNILTVIQGNASLLLNPQADPAEASGCSRQIIQAAERAASLTRQLLIFSRKQIMQPANVDLNEVVANMTKMLRRILGEDIVLQTNYAPDLALIRADSGMIEQVLMNLLVNARDAMPTGGQLILSTSKEKFAEAQLEKNPDAVAGPHVRLTVRDTGGGIPGENLPRIFEPFFTTKAVGKGTGLGLATVYSIIQQHRGWITVSSEVNKGSTFNIYFPAVEGRRVDKEPALAAGKLLHGTGTILVVEDELAVRVLVSNLLQRCGYTVLAAESGVAALKVWQEHQDRIQLLLTDIIMPDGMNGYELAQQLQAARPGLKVVYTSGYSGEVVGKSFNLADGINFLQKPYLPQKLLQILHDSLGQN